MAKLHIGTSGWYYDHWIGTFYPQDMKPRDFLAYYAKHFRATEWNDPRKVVQH